jgi:hypothetical protein
MSEEIVTTVQITKSYSDKLGMLATMDKRTKAAQMEWLIDQEFAAAVPSLFPASSNQTGEPLNCGEQQK